ncbi:MAG: heat-inducible transcription repressor HrcA [Leptolinea sp.]|nr:heat-inducible transcription repressor HrcA [Leptolinea sp.]
MDNLTDRQKMLLTLVIHEFTRTAMPVGSQSLVDHYHLDLSSATVRNELAALEDMGYLRQPHTSAGRSPTEDGYRYFVSQLLQQTDLPAETRRTISHQFYQMRNDSDQWMRLAASVLANQSRAVSLVTAPRPENAILKHLELISTRGRQVLMVMVMTGGEVHQKIFSLNDAFSQEQLSSAAEAITQAGQGLEVDSLKSIRPFIDPTYQAILDTLLPDINQSNQSPLSEVFMDGMTNVLAEPEFSGSEDARRAFRLLEERSMLDDLLSRSVIGSAVGGVHVIIGGDGAWEELRQCSIVLARYGAPGQATGTLGVLGPMRMSYARSISAVRFLSGLLSELVSSGLAD